MNNIYTKINYQKNKTMNKNNNSHAVGEEFQVTVTEQLLLGEHKLTPGTVIYLTETNHTLIVRLASGEKIYAPRNEVIRCTDYDG